MWSIIYSVMMLETLQTMRVVQIHSHEDNTLNCTIDPQQLHKQGSIYWKESPHPPTKSIGILAKI